LQTPLTTRNRHQHNHPRQRNRLIIIMVGLPGRGKTFLCNKVGGWLAGWFGGLGWFMGLEGTASLGRQVGQQQDRS